MSVPSFDDLPVGQKWEPATTRSVPPPKVSPRPSGPVEKKPFLKRGTRMPLSKVPVDPLETVVEPIKNPPVKPRMKENDSHQDDEFVFAKPVRRPSKTTPKPLSARPQWTSPAIIRESAELARFGRSEDEDDDYPPIQSSRKSPSYPSSYKTPEVPRPIQNNEDAVTALLRGSKRPLKPAASPPPLITPPSTELQDKLASLEEQIAKFKKENEQCRRLRVEREAALSDAEKLKSSLQSSLTKAQAELEEERQLVRRERMALTDERQRHGTLLNKCKTLTLENASLKEQITALERDAATREKKSKSERERLAAVAKVAEERVCELEDELKRAVKRSEFISPRETFTREYARPSTVRNPTIQPPREAEPKTEATTASLPIDGISSQSTGSDGRIDTVYSDGRRTASFPSGLKKTVYPSGAALVEFANGDVKETSDSGVVVYRYAATGAVQTSQPGGLEIIEFANGQVEKHYPDGAKEIRFANGVVKRI